LIVSIITPSFNAANYIESAIESVLNQNYKNWEHIIIDGDSSDNTIEIIRKYKHIRFISEPDNGIYDAMNKGVKLAKGDWLYFLGSDDQFVNNYVLDNLFKNDVTQYGVVYGNVYWDKRRFGEVYDKYKIIKRNITHQALFYRKSVFEKHGFYSERYKVWADYEMNLKWIGDPEIKHKYFNIDICNYNTSGYSSNYPLDKRFCKNSINLFKNHLNIKNNDIKFWNSFEVFAKNEVRQGFYTWGIWHLLRSSFTTGNFKSNSKYIFLQFYWSIKRFINK
jgi:glycosyltransferase involved in cell wall biosynthesis